MARQKTGFSSRPHHGFYGQQETGAPTAQHEGHFHVILIITKGLVVITELMLIRHGKTEYDLDPKRISGWGSDALTKCGIKQVRRLCDRLTLEIVDPFSIYTSTLKRAQETAQMIGETLNTTPKELDGLREINKGKLTGLTIPQVKTQYPDFYNAKLTAYEPWPEGEQYAEFHVRLISCLAGIVGEHEDGLAIIVTHGGPINAFVREISGTPISRYHDLSISCGDTSIHHFQKKPEGWRILRLNDCAHLSRGK